MGIWGAFIFAAQMINVPIPGTGASGHLVGALLLCMLLGPARAYLTLAAVLVIQALLFGDGGLMALGANLLNMGAFTCFIAFPFVYKTLATGSRLRLFGAAILASVVGFQLGAFALTIQVALSGMVSLPLGTFMGLMMGIHLPIAVFEGVVTALVMVAVKQPQLPGIVETEAPVGRIRPWQALGVLLLTALLSGVLSWYASGNPDGLEWSLEHTTTGVAQVSGTVVHRELGNLQERTTVFPDYEMAEDTTDGILHGVLSIPGLAGSIIVLAVSLLLGLIIRKRSTVP